MIYSSIKELNKNYPERDKQSFDEELSYVEDCFDTYESIGFADAYETPYADNAKYDGESFAVVRRVSYVKDDVDLEVLPMWRIRFADGTEIDAYPEEICKAERPAGHTPAKTKAELEKELEELRKKYEHMVCCFSDYVGNDLAAAGRSIPVCIGPKEKYLRNKELMERIVKYCTLRDMFDDICFYANGHKYSSDYHQSAIPITIPITSDDVCLVRFDEPSEAPVEATYYDCGECDVRQIVKFCNPDTVTMTFEGEFNSAYNGYYGDNVMEEDITSIANDYGLYPEQGYAWSLAFYEV